MYSSAGFDLCIGHVTTTTIKILDSPDIPKNSLTLYSQTLFPSPGSCNHWLFCDLIILPFCDCYKCGIIQYLAFFHLAYCIWNSLMLPSVSVVVSFLSLCSIPLYNITVCLSIQKLNFQFVEIMNKAAIIIQVQAFGWMYVFI